MSTSPKKGGQYNGKMYPKSLISVFFRIRSIIHWEYFMVAERHCVEYSLQKKKSPKITNLVLVNYLTRTTEGRCQRKSVPYRQTYFSWRQCTLEVQSTKPEKYYFAIYDKTNLLSLPAEDRHLLIEISFEVLIRWIGALK